MVIGHDEALEWYRRNCRRSGELFGMIPDFAYGDRPIPLRNPICFYDGHIPAFGINTLWKRALGQPALNADYESLFERGIDPEAPPDAAGPQWPTRKEIGEYRRSADAALTRLFAEGPLEDDDNPLLRRGQAVYTVLEHEVMHQETLHYMWRRLPFDRKIRPAAAAAPVPGPDRAPKRETVRIPAGAATLGARPDEVAFGWDNEFPVQSVRVPAFEIDVHNVTNSDFLEFVEAGGYSRDDLWDPEARGWLRSESVAHPPFWIRGSKGWEWLGMFERIPLPPAWPVWVTHAEASAYARWKGRRLPSEAEYHRGAYGSPSGAERDFPWGSEPAGPTRGNFDFQSFEPLPVGSFPEGASGWGIHDLIGNGWEWTSTVFAGFPGFQPMASYPQYSADFFDGKHYVMKGASPVTGRELVRRSLRNWFRPNYPHVYASFRCVGPAS
ncbi:MAG: SUMF1/EgtB/PvdO family nonheme iron enzyme [Acidobacteria bacterium]|nr:SUMF1/EgtB/PvdO family nonheme iron enzyme [Acidobacteriota bacterium]